MTGWSFKIVQKDVIPEKKLLVDSICFKISLKADAREFDIGFKKHFEATAMNLALLGFLSSLGS